MKFFKLLALILTFGLSPIALGYANTQTPIDCTKANVYSGTENTRSPVNYSNRVRQALKGRADKRTVVRSAHSPSRQTR